MTYLIHPAQKYYTDNDALFPNLCYIHLYDILTISHLRLLASSTCPSSVVFKNNKKINKTGPFGDRI